MVKNQLQEDQITKSYWYFKGLEGSSNGKDIEISPLKRADYEENFSVVCKATRELRRYTREGLIYLASNGFKIPDSILNGTSQDRIMLRETEAVHERNQILGFNLLGDVIKVLGSYHQILPYETKVADFRKLCAVDEAMKRFLGE